MALSFDQARDAAQGRWKDLIFPAFAMVVPAKKNQHGPCPICGGKDRFRCDDKQGKGTWFCNQCGAGDGFELIVKARGIDRSEVLKEVGAVLGLSSETKVTDEDRKRWREKAEQQRIQAEIDERKAQEAAAKRAKRMWASKSVDRDCPYLDRKQVKNHGCKINGKGNLCVPLFDVDGNIWNMQEIHADGYKPYLSGGRVNDCFYVIGQIKEPYQIVCIAEGYATAASIYEATGYTTIVAFQSGNIDKVGIAVRSRYPELQLVYCADDDSHSSPPDAGLKAANKAVAATGGIVILPDFSQVVNV
ncbi:primase-helicase zinc-binding domain-containing protein [Acinetobacter seifertii]|uniref:primase-helicase zinc-binding domain-containing protein n=1 Tax=Acinetobacter seifertii TaxID=1530123 RepID=UPI0012504460|nr:primase-helicase zinc-binding domain-containing protein [Acinetobacter seifertii]